LRYKQLKIASSLEKPDCFPETCRQTLQRIKIILNTHATSTRCL